MASALTMGLTSCSDFLEEPIRGQQDMENYFTTEEECEKQITGCYNFIACDDWWQIYKFYNLCNITTDDCWMGNTTQDPGEYRAAAMFTGNTIDLGNAVPPLDERYKTPDNIIEGCQSRVWLQADYADGVITFQADSDAIIVKGIISMLIRVLSGHTPTEILNANLYFIDEIGLSEHPSPTRSNGLVAMVKQMKMYALAYKTKEETQQ